MATRNVLTKLTRLAVDDVYLVERPGCHPFDSRDALSAFDAGFREKDKSKSKSLKTFRQFSIYFNLFVFLTKHVILLFWCATGEESNNGSVVLTDGFHRVTLEYFEKPGHQNDAKNEAKNFEFQSTEVRSFEHSIELLGPRHGWNEGDHIDGKSESRFHTVMYCTYIMDMTGCVGKYTTSLICLVLMYCVICEIQS